MQHTVTPHCQDRTCVRNEAGTSPTLPTGLTTLNNPLAVPSGCLCRRKKSQMLHKCSICVLVCSLKTIPLSVFCRGESHIHTRTEPIYMNTNSHLSTHSHTYSHTYLHRQDKPSQTSYRNLVPRLFCMTKNDSVLKKGSCF